MARPLRIEYPGAWYHVINRGRRKEKIFQNEKDYKTFLNVLEQVCRLYAFEIHAYVLLPNHYHLLICTPLGNLSRGMRHLNSVYTQKHNKKHNIDGGIFKGRYKSMLVEDVVYLLELVRYIHRNALEAGLEEAIGQYKWDSHSGYMAEKDKQRWLTTEEVLSRFSQRKNEAISGLNAFVKKTTPKDLLEVLDDIKWPSVLGRKEFKDKIKELIKDKSIDAKEVTGYSEYKIPDSANNKTITAKILSVGKEVLQRKRSRNLSGEKKALIYLLRIHGNSLKEIGKYMGGASYSSVSNQYRRAEKEIKAKKGCYEEMTKISKRLK
jgi:REP element-mobilizing transposase RayT